MDSLSDRNKKIILDKTPTFPIWVNSNVTKIVDGKKCRQVYDLNDPKKTKCVLIEINVKNTVCKENSIFQTIIEKASCTNPFVYNNKLYHTRYKQFIASANCTTSDANVIYEYKSENICNSCDNRNKEPVWESTGRIIKKLCSTNEVITVPLNGELENSHLFELEFTSVITPKKIKLGEQFLATYTIKNIGLNAVQAIAFNAVIPNEVDLVRSANYVFNNNIISKNFNLNIGETVTIQVYGVLLFGSNKNIVIDSYLYFPDGVTNDAEIKYKNTLALKIN